MQIAESLCCFYKKSDIMGLKVNKLIDCPHVRMIKW